MVSRAQVWMSRRLGGPATWSPSSAWPGRTSWATTSSRTFSYTLTSTRSAVMIMSLCCWMPHNPWPISSQGGGIRDFSRFSLYCMLCRVTIDSLLAVIPHIRGLYLQYICIYEVLSRLTPYDTSSKPFDLLCSFLNQFIKIFILGVRRPRGRRCSQIMHQYLEKRKGKVWRRR